MDDVNGADGFWAFEFGQESPFGAARLDFAGGGSLVVDPAAPDRLLRVATTHADAAKDVLAALLGDRFAAVLSGESESGDGSLPDADPGPGSGELCRLAFASWYEAWTPLPVPRPWALLDVGLSAFDAGQHVLAYDAFTEAADELLDQGAKLLDRAVPPALNDAVLRVLTVALLELGDKHPRHADLRRLFQDLHGVTLHVPEAWAAPQLQLAQHLYADPVPPATADWANVAPRVLSTHEGNVFIESTADGVEISVDPHPLLDLATPGAKHLLVRLVHRDSAEVAAVAALRYDAALKRFTARIPQSEIPAGVIVADLVPDVFAAESLNPPVVGAGAEAARARRHLVRSLASARLAAAARLLAAEEPPPATTEARNAVAELRRARRTLSWLSAEHPEYAAWAYRAQQYADGLTGDPDRVLLASAHDTAGLHVADPVEGPVSRALLCELLYAFNAWGARSPQDGEPPR